MNTRGKFRLARFTRLVLAAAHKAAAVHVGKPRTPETIDAIRDDVLKAMRSTAQRYSHLKA